MHRQLALEGGSKFGSVRDPKRQTLIIVQRSRHQLSKADSIQETGSNTSRKGGSEAGQDRQASPKGVAGRGMGVVGQGVQEQICELVARQVFVGRDEWGEHDPLGGDAARSRLRFSLAIGSPSSSQRTLPAVLVSSLIQTSNSRGVILDVLLNAQ